MRPYRLDKEHAKRRAHVVADDRPNTPAKQPPPGPLAPAAPGLPIVTFTPRALDLEPRER